MLLILHLYLLTVLSFGTSGIYWMYPSYHLFYLPPGGICTFRKIVPFQRPLIVIYILALMSRTFLNADMIHLYTKELVPKWWLAFAVTYKKYTIICWLTSTNNPIDNFSFSSRWTLYLGNFLASVFSGPALYINYKTHFLSFRSLQGIHPLPEPCVKFRNKLFFTRRGVLTPSHNPQAGGLPLVGCPLPLSFIRCTGILHAMVTGSKHERNSSFAHKLISTCREQICISLSPQYGTWLRYALD